MRTFQFLVITSFILSVVGLSLKKSSAISCQKRKAHGSLLSSLEKRYQIKGLPRLPIFKWCKNPKFIPFELEGGIDYE